jgi:hypothetical protein
MICIYKVDNIRAHGTNPLTSPLDNSPLAWQTLPCTQVLSLTWNPSFVCGAIPVHSGPRFFENWPPPSLSLPIFPSRSPTVPYSNCVSLYDDITTPASYSPVQLLLLVTKLNFIRRLVLGVGWGGIRETLQILLGNETKRYYVQSVLLTTGSHPVYSMICAKLLVSYQNRKSQMRKLVTERMVITGENIRNKFSGEISYLSTYSIMSVRFFCPVLLKGACGAGHMSAVCHNWNISRHVQDKYPHFVTFQHNLVYIVSVYMSMC